jgi:hypothetical protein
VHTICCFVIDELHVAHTFMPPIAQEHLVRVERPPLSLHSGTNEFIDRLGTRSRPLCETNHSSSSSWTHLYVQYAANHSSSRRT